MKNPTSQFRRYQREVPLRIATLVGSLIIFPALGVAQDSTLPSAHERVVTIVAGVGNDMGWVGLQGEYYLVGDRISVFGGLGYTPEADPGDPDGITPAVGVRGFTPGLRHRGFLEISITQIAIQTLPGGESSRHFGPGVQAGYQFSAVAGFTFLVSFGIGYAIGVDPSLNSVQALFGLGLGYTWR